jgi:hypothetical protein
VVVFFLTQITLFFCLKHLTVDLVVTIQCAASVLVLSRDIFPRPAQISVLVTFVSLTAVAVFVFVGSAKQFFDSHGTGWAVAYLLSLVAEVIVAEKSEKIKLVPADRIFWKNSLSFMAALFVTIFNFDFSSPSVIPVRSLLPLALASVLSFVLSIADRSILRKLSTQKSVSLGVISNLGTILLNSATFDHLETSGIILVSLGVVAAAFFEEPPKFFNLSESADSKPANEGPDKLSSRKKLVSVVLVLLIIIVGIASVTNSENSSSETQFDEDIGLPSPTNDDPEGEYDPTETDGKENDKGNGGEDSPEGKIPEIPPKIAPEIQFESSDPAFDTSDLPSLLFQLKLEHVTHLPLLLLEAVFYSFLDTNPDNAYYDVFFRASWRYDVRKLGYARLNKEDITHVDTNLGQVSLQGEDPRSFMCGGQLFVVDNLYDDVRLIRLSTPVGLPLFPQTTKIPVNGKNFSFFCYQEKIFFVHNFEPLTIYEVGVSQHAASPVLRKVKENFVHSSETVFFNDGSLRGGTPGMQIKGTPWVVGLGHQTFSYPFNMVWYILLPSSCPCAHFPVFNLACLSFSDLVFTLFLEFLR